MSNKKARVFQHGILCGILEQLPAGRFSFSYEQNYQGRPVSMRLPRNKDEYYFDGFPPFFDGLLPEGLLLESLLRSRKIDEQDYLSQLIAVGADLVGSVTVEAYPHE
ncbi:MAG: HipA N-terminal domain-containing protein [Lentisphaeraceae bacterium]|nr:HipA N-terminal domain-containing protein [Lentisphaeraceae bacterium]